METFVGFDVALDQARKFDCTISACGTSEDFRKRPSDTGIGEGHGRRGRYYSGLALVSSIIYCGIGHPR